MEKENNTNGRRFFLGFIILLIGLVMILGRAGVLSYELYDFLLSWKMFIVAIGAMVFFGGNKAAGIVVMGVGVFVMLPDIFEDYYEIRRFFWPAIILLAGVAIMFSNRKGKRFKDSMHFSEGSSSFGSSHMNVNQDYFDEFVIFGGREFNIATGNLRGGKSTAIFGGTEIDARQCQISPQGCTIEVTTLFGANAIKVPNDWTVLNKVTTIFGGYSDLRIKDPSYMPTPSKTIVITGVCIFGATEIKNYSKAH